MNKSLFALLSLLLLCGCAVSSSPQQDERSAEGRRILSAYQYFHVNDTNILTSTDGFVSGNQYGTYGYTTSESLDPAEIIAGFFTKKGFVSLPYSLTGYPEKTFIVTCNESGRRVGLLGYSIEVTLQFIDAQTNRPLINVTAKGPMDSEVNSKRRAIENCFKLIYNEK